jgi:hypothetical protein
VRFYGLLAAERELAKILADEPGRTEKLEIVLVDFGGLEPTVATTARGSPSP